MNEMLEVLENRIAQLEAELDCFWTGNIPDGASLSQVLLAKWGRKRLEEVHNNKRAKLLKGDGL